MSRPRKPKLRPVPAAQPENAQPGKAPVISPGLYKDTSKKQEPYSVPTKKKEQRG